MTDLYPRRTYPAAVVGSSNGAAVHLWGALGIPWLPQTFLVPVARSGVHPDEPFDAMHWAVEPAPNEHPVWALCRAELIHFEDDGLLASVGLGDLGTRPPDHVTFSDGVAARFGLPVRATTPRAVRPPTR